MERSAEILLLYLPATVEELCQESKVREDGSRAAVSMLSVEDVGVGVLVYRAHNPSPSQDHKAAFRPLNLHLTVSFPNGSRPIQFGVCRDRDVQGLFLRVDTTPVQEKASHLQREYLLAVCDFARSVGCTRTCLPARYCAIVMK